MIYKAKKDKMVYLFPIVMFSITVLVDAFKGEFDLGTFLVTALIAAIVFGFFAVNMLTIRYIVTETELMIKTCMFKTVLKLDKITEVRQEGGGYSFSASSMEQLKLLYNDGQKIRISPQNLREFEEMLNEKIATSNQIA